MAGPDHPVTIDLGSRGARPAPLTAGDVESAEAEVYGARTSADQGVAAAEARLAEEMNRRREAEADRDQAQADREEPRRGRLPGDQPHGRAAP
jgi:hypothetical protein